MELAVRHRSWVILVLALVATGIVHARELARLWDHPVVASRVRDGLEYDLEEMKRRATLDGDWKMVEDQQSQGLWLAGDAGTITYRFAKTPGQSLVVTVRLASPSSYESRIEVSPDGSTWTPVAGNLQGEGTYDLREHAVGEEALFLRFALSVAPDATPAAQPFVFLEHVEVETFDHMARLPPLAALLSLLLLPFALLVLAECAGLPPAVALGTAIVGLAASQAASIVNPDLLMRSMGIRRYQVSAVFVGLVAASAIAAASAWLRRAWSQNERALERVGLFVILAFALAVRWRLLEHAAHVRLDPDAETVFGNVVSMSLANPYGTGAREPLWPWMVKLFLAVFGESELRLRYFSLTFGMLVIYAGYKFVRDYTQRGGLALVFAMALSFHSVFIHGAIRGLRTELLTLAFLVLTYFVFMPALSLRKRLPGLIAGCVLITLTSLSSLSAQGLLLLYAWWRHKLPIRAVVVPLVVAGVLVAPHLVNNYRSTGDPMYTVNMYGIWWRNYEFVIVEGTGCEGCPTRVEFQQNSMTGTKVSLTGYIFGMHPFPEVVRRVVEGYWQLFLARGRLFADYVGSELRLVHLLYLSGVVLLLFSRWRELVLMPLLTVNLVAFTFRLGIDSRLIAHVTPVGVLATALPVWLLILGGRTVLERVTGMDGAPKPMSKSGGGTAHPPARFTKQDRIAWYDQGGDLREHYKKINRYYHSELERFFSFAVPPGTRVLEVGCSTGDLLNAVKPAYGVGIDISGKTVELARKKYPHLTFEQADIEELPADFVAKHGGPFDYVILSDTLGELDDILKAFESIAKVCTPQTRLVISYYSYLWEPVLKLGERIGSKMPQRLQSWLSTADIEGFLALAGFETVRRGTRTLVPRDIPGLAWLANRLLAHLPGFRSLCLVEYLVARPASTGVAREPSVTVLVPTRNEAGNIEGAVTRIPKLGRSTEILFVDGSSTDGTVEKIEELQRKYAGEKDIKLLHQVPRRATEAEAVKDGLISAPGKMLKLGKGDAVRKGFDAATGDIVMILDADLTVPPEDLPKFVKALAENRGEFVNGTRLVYPMEKQAMRFLNLLANKGFSVIFTWLLDQRIKDTLCGTKALWKTDYQRIKDGRAFFGDFDPFGDFDLLFGAAKVGLKIVEVPIRYRERVYGDVKIERFKHGLLLLRMCGVAFKKLKMI